MTISEKISSGKNKRASNTNLDALCHGELMIPD
jgi:hypothetical protein